MQCVGTPAQFDPACGIYLIGNGGSAAIASHIANDLVKGGWHAVALTDPAVMSCIANDVGWADVFAWQVMHHIAPGEWLWAISSSGRSANILRAAHEANALRANVMTLSGFDANNPLRTLGDVNYYVPSHNYGVVEICHLAILHSIVNPGQ